MVDNNNNNVQHLSDLHFISEETILNILTKQYSEKNFYSKIGQLFCKINSFPNYEIEYQDSSYLFLNDLQKWSKANSDKLLNEKQSIFKFAEEFRRYACDGNATRQSLILRGVSGSGKTDNASIVSKRIAASITLLEAFYTAPTDHNLYSSRVSTYYRLRYTLNGKLSGFRVDPLFADFVRCNPKDLYLGPLTIQTLVVNGLPTGELDRLLIPSSLREQYPPNPDFDYTEQLAHVRETVITYGGISADIWDAVIKVIAAVINLQGITLLGTESAIISSSTKSFIGQAEQLLNLESGSLGPAVLKKPDERIGRPAGSLADCKPLEAKYLIEIVSAEIMYRTVSFLLNEMSYNYSLPEKEGESSTFSTLHILDPIGWDRNSLNQVGNLTTLMNHYCEEKLSEHYLFKAFNEEFERYGREGITIDPVVLPEWHNHIDFIERPVGGLIQILEEICQNQRGEDKSIADKIILNHAKSKLVKSGGAKTKQTVFIIKHLFSDISYDCDGFITANKYGALPTPLINAIKTSKFSFLSADPVIPVKLIEPKAADGIKVIKPRSEQKGLSPQNFAFFRTQNLIESVIQEFNSCEKTNYLICLNLQPFSKSGETIPSDYLPCQLKSLYLEGLIKLAQSGFAYSRPYHDIYRRFRILLPFSNTALPLQITDAVEANYPEFCKTLLRECVTIHKLNVQEPNWESSVTYGRNVLFMKEKFAVKLEAYLFSYYEKSSMSCLLVQSLIRMRKWRKQFLILRKGKAIQRLRYKRLIRAAKRFHSLAKGFIVRRHSQNVYDSIRLIQRAAKVFVQRKKTARIRLASALKIQYNYRGYKVRQINASFVRVLKVRKEQRIAQRVVQKIQSLWRKKLVVERFQEIVSAVVVLQRWLRTCKQRQWFKELRSLVIRLQSHWRRITATKLVNALKVTNMVRLEKESLSELFVKETSCLQEFTWEECTVGESVGKKSVQKLKRLLITFDFCFDLSFAYSDGWLKTFFEFEKSLIENEHRYIKLINIGNHHTILVDDKSNVYTMGLGDLGQLGQGHRKSLSYPKKIEKLKSILTAGYGMVTNPEVKTEIMSVGCGKDHTILLTNGGLLFSWGDNRRGQLGHSNFESSAIPKVVLTHDQKPLKNVTQISCGAFHSACIADPGTIYTWGNGDCLGTSPNFRHEDEFDTKMVDNCYPTPLPIFLKKKMVQVVCGESHVTAVCAGEVYSWGLNQYGQLGLGNTRPQYVPKKIPTIQFPEFDTIHVKLFTGGRHMMFLLKGKILLWGWNKYGQIGDGTTENALNPFTIDTSKLPSKAFPSASAVASPAVVNRKTAISEDSKDIGRGLKLESKNSAGNKPKITVISAYITWRQSMIMTNTKEIFTWGVVNNIIPYTKSVKELTNDNLYLSGSFHEPFEINLKPRLLSLDEIANQSLSNPSENYTADSFSNYLVGLNGCSHFALSLISVELESTISTKISPVTTLPFSDEIPISSVSMLATPTKTGGRDVTLLSSSVGKLNISSSNRVSATLSAAKAKTVANFGHPSSEKKDKVKFTSVINPKTKVTKDIKFESSAEEILKRFRQEVGRVTLYPGNQNQKRFVREELPEESKHDIDEPVAESKAESMVVIKSSSLMNTTRSSSKRQQSISQDSSEDGGDSSFTSNPKAVGSTESLVELFHPSHLKKMKALKHSQQERLKLLQKELHDNNNLDFGFSASSKPSSPYRSRSAGGDREGGTSFLQNFLQGAEALNSSRTPAGGRTKSDNARSSRRYSGSPLSRFVSSKAVVDEEDEEILSPSGAKKSVSGKGTRDSFIWTAGSPTNSTRKGRAGSLSNNANATAEPPSSPDPRETKSSATKRTKLFSPTATLLTADPLNSNVSFKEQMHELGYLRKKTTPRFLFSENPTPLLNVDINKISSSPARSLPTSSSPLLTKRDTKSGASSSGPGNTRNSLEKLKRELIYMQQK